MDAELGHADAEELQEARLAGIEDVAGAADDVAPLLVVGGAVGGLLEHDLALDHARGDAEAAQLGLDGVAHGDVVLGGDLAAGGHDDAARDDELAGGGDAGAREVHLAQLAEVGEEGGRGAVREEEAHGALEVGRQLVEVVGLAVFGGVAQGARHELRLAEEEAEGPLLVCERVGWVGATYRLSESSWRTSLR